MPTLIAEDEFTSPPCWRTCSRRMRTKCWKPSTFRMMVHRVGHDAGRAADAGVFPSNPYQGDEL